MSLDADYIVDRRRMRRKLTFWRVFAGVLSVVVGGGAAGVIGRSSGRFGGPGASIARIKIQGLIRNDQSRVEALERLGRSNVRAVIVHIHSPRGSTAGSAPQDSA